ncbi:MAG: class I SAM-dependent methyltransferase [Candidatus Hodarchaeales archaeon]|jgi:ubiquinone/menaquinone biosynthesis C-methylase UbiE
MTNEFFELNKDIFRENFNKYTRKAFKMLPELEKPRILDIGCGSGVPTVELAKLSDGEIVGIDIDQTLLDKLNKKIKENDLSNRMRTMKCSLFEMDFPSESFDIIWAEGLQFIDFKKRLKEWKQLLKSNGFLVLHEDRKNMSNKIKITPSCGYKLINHFSLPEDAWWTEYYGPLEIQINKLRRKYKNNPEALKQFKKDQNEIDMVKKNPKEIGSVFFILHKQ